jgi:hypothetical protein
MVDKNKPEAKKVSNEPMIYIEGRIVINGETYGFRLEGRLERFVQRCGPVPT